MQSCKLYVGECNGCGECKEMNHDNHVKLFEIVNESKAALDYWGVCKYCGCLLLSTRYCGNPYCDTWASEDTFPQGSECAPDHSEHCCAWVDHMQEKQDGC